MHAFALTRKRGLLMGTAALAVGILGACKSSEVLNVSTPDFLNVDAYSTPAGADPLRYGVISDFTYAFDGNTDAFTVASGNLADEIYTTDTFDGRLQVNARRTQEVNNEMESEYRKLQQAHVGANTAIQVLATAVPDQKWQRAQMYMYRGYLEIFFADAWCSGTAFSSQSGTTITYGQQLTTAQLYQAAVASFDSALALTDASKDGLQVKYGSQIGKGRALVDLGKYTEAAAAVAGVPQSFVLNTFHSTASSREENGMWNATTNGSSRYSIIGNEGTNGLNYLQTPADPRMPWSASTRIGFNSISRNLPNNLKFGRTTSGIVSDGIEGQLIALEARLQGGTQADRDAVFAGLNALRASNTPAIAPIAGSAPTTQNAAVDQLFQERAYWFWLTGRRLGDLRRLVRNYGRSADSVFPVGNLPAPIPGTYGEDTSMKIPFNERNNPNVQGAASTCLDTNP
jgi:hypothetical protein